MSFAKAALRASVAGAPEPVGVSVSLLVPKPLKETPVKPAESMLKVPLATLSSTWVMSLLTSLTVMALLLLLSLKLKG